MTSETQENRNIPQGPAQKNKDWLRIAAKLFKKHNCMMKASALSYTSIVSIVPITALLLVVSRGCGFDVEFQTNLTRCFIGQEQIARQILSFADNALHAAHGGTIQGFGLLILLIMAFSFQLKIRSCFQDIWSAGAKGDPFYFPVPSSPDLLHRILGRRFRQGSQFLLLLLLSPVFALIFVSISGQGIARLEAIPQVPGKHGFITFIRCVGIPLLFAWVSFFVFYLLFLPSSRSKQNKTADPPNKWTVIFFPPLAACVPTGILFIAGQYICMYLQNLLTNYNATYGKFAAIPFFLIWVHISWCIVLIGALIAFMLQDGDPSDETLSEENAAQMPLSSHYRAVCALRIMKLLGEASGSNNGDDRFISVRKISERLNIPVSDAFAVLNDLKSADLISDREKEKERLFAYFLKPQEECTPTVILKKLSMQAGKSRHSRKGEQGDPSTPQGDATDANNAPPESGEARGHDAEKILSEEEAEMILKSLWEKAGKDNPYNDPLISEKPASSDSGQKTEKKWRKIWKKLLRIRS